MTELSEKRKRIMFVAGFVALVIISVDFWNWTSSKPLIMGMPFWVVWDIIVVILTGIYYILFCTYLWRD